MTSAELGRIAHATRVRIGGLVVARQRPGTAGGVCFMLLEDEHGTINLVVPPAVYERHRLVVRTEPLVLAEGVLERYAAGGGAVNVLVRRLHALDAPDRPLAEVKDFSPLDERERERRAQTPPHPPAAAAAWRGRRIPRRGAARHVLCPGAQALRPPGAVRSGRLPGCSRCNVPRR